MEASSETTHTASPGGQHSNKDGGHAGAAPVDLAAPAAFLHGVWAGWPGEGGASLEAGVFSGPASWETAGQCAGDHAAWEWAAWQQHPAVALGAAGTGAFPFPWAEAAAAEQHFGTWGAGAAQQEVMRAWQSTVQQQALLQQQELQQKLAQKIASALAQLQRTVPTAPGAPAPAEAAAPPPARPTAADPKALPVKPLTFDPQQKALELANSIQRLAGNAAASRAVERPPEPEPAARTSKEADYAEHLSAAVQHFLQGCEDDLLEDSGSEAGEGGEEDATPEPFGAHASGPRGDGGRAGAGAAGHGQESGAVAPAKPSPDASPRTSSTSPGATGTDRSSSGVQVDGSPRFGPEETPGGPHGLSLSALIPEEDLRLRAVAASGGRAPAPGTPSAEIARVQLSGCSPEGVQDFLNVLKRRALPEAIMPNLPQIQAYLHVCIQSFYRDRLLPSQARVARRLRDMGCASAVQAALLPICARSERFRILPPMMNAPPVIFLAEEPANFPGWIDPEAKEVIDIFSADFWAGFAAFLRMSAPTLPGQPHYAAMALRECCAAPLQRLSLAELELLVRLAVDRHKLLEPVGEVLKPGSAALAPRSAWPAWHAPGQHLADWSTVAVPMAASLPSALAAPPPADAAGAAAVPRTKADVKAPLRPGAVPVPMADAAPASKARPAGLAAAVRLSPACPAAPPRVCGTSAPKQVVVAPPGLAKALGERSPIFGGGDTRVPAKPPALSRAARRPRRQGLSPLSWREACKDAEGDVPVNDDLMALVGHLMRQAPDGGSLRTLKDLARRELRAAPHPHQEACEISPLAAVHQLPETGGKLVCLPEGLAANLQTVLAGSGKAA